MDAGIDNDGRGKTTVDDIFLTPLPALTGHLPVVLPRYLVYTHRPLEKARRSFRAAVTKFTAGSAGINFACSRRATDFQACLATDGKGRDGESFVSTGANCLEEFFAGC